MKARRLTEAKESAGTDLALALKRIAALEDRQDRAAVVALGLNARLAVVEERLDIGAPPEIAGLTVAGFAAKVHRSPSTVRKLIAQGRLPLLPRLGVHPIIAADAELPARRRSR